MNSLLLVAGILAFSAHARAAEWDCVANAFISSSRIDGLLSTRHRIAPRESIRDRYNTHKLMEAFTCDDKNGIPVNLDAAMKNDIMGYPKISRIFYEYGGKQYEYDLSAGEEYNDVSIFAYDLITKNYDQGNPLLQDLGKKIGRKPELKNVLLSGLDFTKRPAFMAPKGEEKPNKKKKSYFDITCVYTDQSPATKGATTVKDPPPLKLGSACGFVHTKEVFCYDGETRIGFHSIATCQSDSEKVPEAVDCFLKGSVATSDGKNHQDEYYASPEETVKEAK